MDPSSPSFTLFWYYVVGSISLALFALHFWNERSRRKLPPGPPGLPILGNLLQLGTKPNESLLHLANQYGPLMTLRLGLKTTVVVSSPAMAKEILKHNDQIFAGRTVPHALKSLSFNESSVSFGQYGSRWRTRRRMYNEHLLSARRLEAMRHLRNEEICRMMKLVFQDSVEGTQVDIGRVVFLTSFNLLGNMVFGRYVFDPHAESSQQEQFRKIAVKSAELAGKPNLADFFPFLQILDPQGVRRDFTANLTRLYEIFDKLINERCASMFRKSEAEKDLLDVMLDIRSSEFTLTDIKASLFEIFVAGTDTTSVTIEWAMAELIRNPHAMKRAQQELEKVVGRHRRVEESDVDHLPYLRAVVKEVFRLHPAAPLMLPHRAERDCEIAGFMIPEHTQVIVNVWGIGRNQSVWSDPHQFLPDRFIESDVDYKGQNFELLPFGSGRRICAGLSMGDRIVRLVIASLLHSFDWALPGGMKAEHVDMTGKFGATLRKAIPLNMIPTPRISPNLY